MERYRKLRGSDGEMNDFRSHPEIQRWEAWLGGPRTETFQYDGSKYDDLHRRYDNRNADLYEMIARDEDEP